mmetsp:Transcript_23236/g.53750  ORF Transcript_23236/g.53750 Transcript_23236/m.53750 type:complete len:108 (-) Transcript_23236:19-342(-)
MTCFCVMLDGLPQIEGSAGEMMGSDRDICPMPIVALIGLFSLDVAMPTPDGAVALAWLPLGSWRNPEASVSQTSAMAGSCNTAPQTTHAPQSSRDEDFRIHVWRPVQ